MAQAPESPAMDRAGFTLIEIVAALAILGLAMVVLLEAHHGGLRMFDATRENVVMRELTAHALGVAELGVCAGNAAGDGDFGERYPGYEFSYEADILSEDYPSLYSVIVTVRNPDGEEQEIELLLFVPGVA